MFTWHLSCKSVLETIYGEKCGSSLTAACQLCTSVQHREWVRILYPPETVGALREKERNYSNWSLSRIWGPAHLCLQKVPWESAWAPVRPLFLHPTQGLCCQQLESHLYSLYAPLPEHLDSLEKSDSKGLMSLSKALNSLSWCLPKAWIRKCPKVKSYFH